MTSLWPAQIPDAGARDTSRRRLVSAAVAVALVGALVGLGIAGLGPFGGHGRPILAPPAGAQPRGSAMPGASSTAGTPFTPPAPGTRAFATVRGVILYLPATAIVKVAYHEASFPVALALSPLGRCVRDYNRTKFTKPPPTVGPDYIVMSSRGRRQPATSAADIAMLPGTTVLSPVTGVVVSAKAYRLYGRYRDMRIAIRPDGVRGVQVVVIHVDRVIVHAGQRLYAGVTPIGIPRVFPFSSQVNDYIGPGIPHVHVEVNKVGATGHETSD